MARVPVYEYNDYGEEQIVATVEYNDNLDFWDGSNFSSGSPFRHMGLTKLKDGRYVLIYGSQWEGETNYGVVVSPKEALCEVLRTGNSELLNDPRFKELKELEKTLVKEDI